MMGLDSTLGQETIVAVATPVGRGGIGVVRLSGDEALRIVGPLVRLRRAEVALAPGRARFGEVVDRETGEVLDEAVVTYFAGPRSYTGEDVVEVAVHGAPVVLESLLRACCTRGARLAEPGEFTRRAFLHGRMDLTQAEAVGDLIDASTLEQARLAARQMGGALAREIGPTKAGLVELIAEMEAGIDFAEDDVAVLLAASIVERVASLEAPLAALARSFAYGRVVREGFTLALVGRPNVGKSSLFNRLVGRDRSIVTALAGTTRDTVAERVSLSGVPVELVDTAGLRGAAGSSQLDEAELLGIARSHEAMSDAAVVVLVVDAQQGIEAEDLRILESCRGRPVIVAVNKVDLVAVEDDAAAGPPPSSSMGRQIMEHPASMVSAIATVQTSAVTGTGIDELREAVLQVLRGEAPGAGSAMVTNLRQQQAIASAIEGLAAARMAASGGIPHEMVLMDLYRALRGLDELTGATTTEDVLQLIFGRFCIGK